MWLGLLAAALVVTGVLLLERMDYYSAAYLFTGVNAAGIVDAFHLRGHWSDWRAIAVTLFLVLAILLSSLFLRLLRRTPAATLRTSRYVYSFIILLHFSHLAASYFSEGTRYLSQEGYLVASLAGAMASLFLWMSWRAERGGLTHGIWIRHHFCQLVWIFTAAFPWTSELT